MSLLILSHLKSNRALHTKVVGDYLSKTVAKFVFLHFATSKEETKQVIFRFVQSPQTACKVSEYTPQSWCFQVEQAHQRILSKEQ